MFVKDFSLKSYYIADKMSSSKKRQLSGEVSRSEDDKRACSADRLPAPASASSAACVSNSPPKVSGKHLVDQRT